MLNDSRTASADRAMTIDDVIARTQITDVIYRYCRALDRMDRDLALSCWHPGGTDSHGPLFGGTGEGFVEWVWPVHEEMIATRHTISNIQIELHGDWAGAESYASLILRVPRGDDVYDCIFHSRYLDRFERIDGVWKIRHRLQIRDLSRFEQVGDTAMPPPGDPLIRPNNPENPAAVATRDENDPSFAVLYGPR